MAIISQKHYGYEIRVDEEGGRFVARVLRNGEMVNKATGDRAADVFEEAWCWSSMNRPVQLRVASNLIEHVLEYEDPYGGRAKVYTSTVRADADEAMVVLEAGLREQWSRELDEHIRRRDNLAAEMEEIGGKIREVESEIEPLKERKAFLQQRMRDAPGLVYRPSVEFKAVDELPLVMERRKAGGRFKLADAIGVMEERAADVGAAVELEKVITDELDREAGDDMDRAANGPRKVNKKKAKRGGR